MLIVIFLFCSTKIRCGQLTRLKCENKCMKIMKCGKHHCQMKCHEGMLDVLLLSLSATKPLMLNYYAFIV